MKKRLLFLTLILAALLCATSCNNAPAEPPSAADIPAETPAIVDGVAIQWKEPAIEALVRQELGKPEGIIYQEELEYIEYLELFGESHLFINFEYGEVPRELDFHYFDSHKNMLKDGTYEMYGQQYTRGSTCSLDDFVNFRNLKQLWVNKNSLKGLAGLTFLKDLEVLGLVDDEIQDVRDLSSLTQLKELFLDQNNIEDLADLSGFGQITYLSLSGSQISSLEWLAGFRNVVDLSLAYTALTSLEGLEKLESLERLERLYIDGTGIESVSVLAGNTSLNTLHLKYLKAASFDLAQLAAIPNLEIVTIRQTQAELINFRSLAELKYLKYLGIIPNINVSDEDIEWLRGQLPFCTIE